MHHLDTNIIIAYLNGDRQIAEKIKVLLPDVAMSAFVLAELRYGARASARATDNLRRIEQLLQIIDVVDFDQKCADSYSHLRLALRKKGKPTGEMDLLIASVAVANQAVLVTHNTRHFSEIEGLDLEDWLA